LRLLRKSLDPFYWSLEQDTKKWFAPKSAHGIPQIKFASKSRCPSYDRRPTRVLIEIAARQRITVETLVDDILNDYIRSESELRSKLEAWQEIGAEALDKVERLL